MAYTVNDLVVHVLRALRVIDPTEVIGDVEAGHVTHVTAIYNAKWEEMSSHGRDETYWPRDSIPNPVFLIVRDLVALECQAEFGMPIPIETKDARENLILKRLRTHTQIQSSGRPTEAEYF